MRFAHRTVAVTAVALSSWAAGRSADAAIVVVSQTRSVSTGAITNATPAYAMDGPTRTLSDPHSDTSTAAGPYASTVTSNANQTVPGDGLSATTQVYTYDASATANQSWACRRPG